MTNSEMLEFNTTTLHLWMKENNVESIVIDYSGGGDSGGINSITDGKGNDLWNSELLCMGLKYPKYLDANISYQSHSNAELMLGNISSICYPLWEKALVTTGNNGFGNNEGGQGKLTISDDMTALFEHSNNYYVDANIEDFCSSAFDENIKIDNILEHIKSQNEQSFSIDLYWYGEVELDEEPSPEINEEIDELVNFAFQNLDEDISNVNGTLTVNLDGTFTVEASGESIESEGEHHEIEYAYDQSYIDKVMASKNKPRFTF